MFSGVRTIAIAAQKGGAGKTTVTVHLAVAAMLAGERVAIVDTDPQRTALAWAQTRGDGSPMVVATTRIEDAKREATEDGYTLLRVDTAPVAAAATSAHLRAADFVLVPLRPAAFDLTTLDQTLALVRAADTPGAIVLNACPARALKSPKRAPYAPTSAFRSRRSSSGTVALIRERCRPAEPCKSSTRKGLLRAKLPASGSTSR